MKENTSSFYVDRVDSYETTIEYANSVADNNAIISAHLDKTIYFW